ncbi:MAG: hypothetical protein ACD_76C00151G0005 [uncultured bacterium]|nr:MAG: hypothetical protein ACD_76C00151G0005 [uncultured bacterium]HBD04879.1 exodeoxyribonuclease VII small subunit [Candidatus Uhrbacteria bacterium]
MAKKALKKKSESVDFAKAFSELEEITKWFESGSIDVDEGLKKFERGIELSKQCQKKLAEVQNRIEELKNSNK